MAATLLSRAFRTKSRRSRELVSSLSHQLLDPYLSNPLQNPRFSKPRSDSPSDPKFVDSKIVTRNHCLIREFGFNWGLIGIGRSDFSVARICTSSGVKSGGDERAKGVEVSWIDVHVPESVRPYAKLARLDKPIGTWLLAWPCMWSIALAASPGSLPDIKMMLLFGCGSLLLRGAGCTVNDLLDRDIDIKVERTKLRPVASGLLTPFQGLTFLGFQLLLGLGILLQLNNYSVIIAASIFLSPHEEADILGNDSLNIPQAYLGLTFNWGALLGWAAVKGSLDPALVFPLYISGVAWTLVYDTIYAHQDKEDDLKVGVKSTALRFGSLTKNWISGFGVACISNLALSGYNSNMGWPFYAFLMAGAGQLAWQIQAVDLSNRADCNQK
ncbi:hypothetical protein Sjap_012594 [Stephania japonica]|uniref:4-hydroxybenzoate polyprenyltransferase, mitochondrial n=1 Tax=Stephania japonica TaxID=461633 RepID=A0AAP0NWY1_9MAGN